MKVIFMNVLFVTLFLTGCNMNPSQTRFVDAAGGLKMRSEPGTHSETILLIPDGSKVTLLQEQGETITISGRSGKWSRINFQGNTGWAFGGFLVSPPTIKSKSSEIHSDFHKLAGPYSASGSAEPGNMKDWLSITKTSISAGRGGMMEADWYCLIASAELSENHLYIVCDMKKEPTKQEVEFGASRATRKEKLMITVSSPEIQVDGRTYRRR